MKDLCLANVSVMMKMVLSENGRQVRKWGIQDRDPFQWLAFANEELGELAKAIIEWHFRGASPVVVVNEAIQAATLCLKIAEMFDAQEEKCENK